MTYEPKRHLAGSAQGGGRFAPDEHPEASGVSLGSAPAVVHTAALSGTVELSNEWFDQLPEWPAGMPEPEVNFGFEGGRAETYVVVDGKMATFWTDPNEGTVDDTRPDGVYSQPSQWESFDEEDKDAARDWGKAVHERIDSSTYGVMIEASHSPAVKNIILAQALGKEAAPAPDLTDENVRREISQDAEKRLYQATCELQRIYLVGVAVELREQHPTIDSFELSGDGEEPFMEVAWDAEGNEIDKDTLAAANHGVFRRRSHDDFDTLMTSDPVYVPEAAAFRPGAARG
jgi:hypothetical protein